MTTEEKRIKIAGVVGKDADYFNDLNAMHEAEKVLTKTQWANYMMHYLPSICWAVVTKQDAHQQGNVIHATAAERAEAFGRTLNLWTE